MSQTLECLALASLVLTKGTLSLDDFERLALDPENREFIDEESLQAYRRFQCLSQTSFEPRASLADEAIGADERSFGPIVNARIDQLRLIYRELGAEIIYPFHRYYPRSFYELESPPLFLSCLGDASILRGAERVAIVGSRELSVRTEQWMEHHLADFLRACPRAVIVSGGARGADQAAHLAAVRARKPTIVVLPSGLRQIFPRDLQTWIDPVLRAGGVFVSAYAPDEPSRNFRFEARNRLIASLGQIVFITEASLRSGSMMTSRLAGELGREVCALPSFPGELVGQGTLELLASHNAVMIRDASDLAVLLSRAVTHDTQAESSLPSATQRESGSDREESVGHPHGNDRR